MTNSKYNFPFSWSEVTSDLLSSFDDLFEYHNRDVTSKGSKSFKLPYYKFTKDDDKYIASFDLPGVKKEDIKTSIENSILNISATRTIGKDEVTYQDRFRLPNTVSIKKPKATYVDGVLTLVFGENKDNVTEIKID